MKSVKSLLVLLALGSGVAFVVDAQARILGFGHHAPSQKAEVSFESQASAASLVTLNALPGGFSESPSVMASQLKGTTPAGTVFTNKNNSLHRVLPAGKLEDIGSCSSQSLMNSPLLVGDRIVTVDVSGAVECRPVAAPVLAAASRGAATKSCPWPSQSLTHGTYTHFSPIAMSGNRALLISDQGLATAINVNTCQVDASCGVFRGDGLNRAPFQMQPIPSAFLENPIVPVAQLSNPVVQSKEPGESIFSFVYLGLSKADGGGPWGMSSPGYYRSDIFCGPQYAHPTYQSALKKGFENSPSGENPTAFRVAPADSPSYKVAVVGNQLLVADGAGMRRYALDTATHYDAKSLAGSASIQLPGDIHSLSTVQGPAGPKVLVLSTGQRGEGLVLSVVDPNALKLDGKSFSLKGASGFATGAVGVFPSSAQAGGSSLVGLTGNRLGCLKFGGSGASLTEIPNRSGEVRQVLGIANGQACFKTTGGIACLPQSACS